MAPTGTLADLLLGSGASTLPDELVFCDGAWTGRAGLVDDASRLTAALEDAGAGPGRAVVSLVASSPASVATMFGVWATGATLAPLNPRLAAPERDRLLDQIRPVAVVDDAGVHAGSGDRVRSSCTDLDREIALVLLTSGTTGPPKPVLLRHRSILTGIDAVLASIGPRAGAPAPNLIAFPLELWSGIYSVCFSLRVGAPMLLLRRFEPSAFVALVHRFSVPSCVLAPAMIAMLADDASIDDLGSLRYVRNATAPLSPAQAGRFRERFGVLVLNGYGQTELGGEVIGWNAADVRAFGSEKLGSVGRPHPGIEVRCVADDDTPVGPGEVGELCVRSPYVMAGYLSDPGVSEPTDATARLTRDGLLRTGDLGFVDDDGFVWLEGRRSDVVNRSGLKVFPGEVEEVLRGHPAVADVAVVGMPDERLGEVPWAFVVPHRDAVVDPATLDAHARDRLAPYKVPARFVVVGELPRNDIGKVLRRELRDAHVRAPACAPVCSFRSAYRSLLHARMRTAKHGRA